MFLNYHFKYQVKKRTIFVPNNKSINIGCFIIKLLESKLSIPDCYFHFQNGGHVAALHKHRKNKFFFKIDLERFYYTISRNRVAATLYDLGDPQARNHAKWSSVKNPFVFPRYSLPIGFIQSPIISAAVLMRSPMQIAIDSAQRDGITVSVYFDDIIGSANELEPLTQAYERLKSAINESSFILNTAKTVDPCDMLTAFNCHLSHNRTFVTEARIKLFDERTASVARAEAFRRYCESVSD